MPLEVMLQFEIITCCHQGCGMTFAIPQQWERERRRDHSWWYCPNGHQQHFPAESDIERMKREKREAELKAQAELNEVLHTLAVTERERDKERRARRKLERRTKAGVCACCNRTFPDLTRHMQTKHKDFALLPGERAKQITGTVQ